MCSTFTSCRISCGFSGVAAAVLSCHFGGGAGSVKIIFKQAHHPLLVSLNGKKVDDWIQAAVEVH